MGLGGLPGKARNMPAETVPGGSEGVDARGILPPGERRIGQAAAHAVAGNDLRHGDPGERGEYITLEAARQGRAEITLKGKVRTILLPGKLCRKLLKYARKKNILSGEIFLTRGGKRLNRKNIWAEMKALCPAAGVAASKVFPHNLRHLFAKCFYDACRDLVKLADVLGHSSVETMRIYLLSRDAACKTLGSTGIGRRDEIYLLSQIEPFCPQR